MYIKDTEGNEQEPCEACEFFDRCTHKCPKWENWNYGSDQPWDFMEDE